MKEKDAEPLVPPPRLSLAAAARMHDMLTASDEHGNYLFRATAPVLVQKLNGELLELGTAGEVILVVQQALGGFTDES